MKFTDGVATVLDISNHEWCGNGKVAIDIMAPPPLLLSLDIVCLKEPRQGDIQIVVWTLKLGQCATHIPTKWLFTGEHVCFSPSTELCNWM